MAADRFDISHLLGNTVEDTVDVLAQAQADGMRERGVVVLDARCCVVCGCTDDAPCPGGCAWVSDDLDVCTACAEEELE